MEQAMYQSRLNDMAKEIAAIKTEKAAKQKPLPQVVKYKDLGTLHQEVFNTLPGTVNVNRGGAIPPTGTSVNWGGFHHCATQQTSSLWPTVIYPQTTFKFSGWTK